MHVSCNGKASNIAVLKIFFARYFGDNVIALVTNLIVPAEVVYCNVG